jgi:hypothetical protein
VANTGAEEIPPGATTAAADRPLETSGAGPRHAANDEGSPAETYGPADTNDPLAEGTLEGEDRPREPEEEGPPYAGISGGAVGGTPAQGRSTGGRTGHGIAPERGRHGDSTIGTNPDAPTD